MAKQAVDHFTLDLLDKPKRGRPRKPDALTDAQRARSYRQRKREAKAYTARLKANGCTGLYRGPYGETWTGRGLMPKWLSVYVREGTDKQAFWVPL